jgi:hypothetical protein
MSEWIDSSDFNESFDEVDITQEKVNDIYHFLAPIFCILSEKSTNYKLSDLFFELSHLHDSSSIEAIYEYIKTKENK